MDNITILLALIFVTLLLLFYYFMNMYFKVIEIIDRQQFYTDYLMEMINHVINKENQQ